LLNRIRALVLVLFAAVLFVMLVKDYGDTLIPRDDAWSVHYYYFAQHPDKFWFGAGLDARDVSVLNYIPRYITYDHRKEWEPHNLYIIFTHAIGFVGLLFYLTGLASVFIRAQWENTQLLRHSFKSLAFRTPTHVPYKRLKNTVDNWTPAHWAYWATNAGMPLAIVSIIIGGTNDHVFYDTYLFTWMLVLFALRYALPWETYSALWLKSFPAETV
jgi:hypothetical protein